MMLTKFDLSSFRIEIKTFFCTFLPRFLSKFQEIRPCFAVYKTSMFWLRTRALLPVWQSRRGERLGESNVCKTMAGAVPSITDIYSLVFTHPMQRHFADVIGEDAIVLTKTQMRKTQHVTEANFSVFWSLKPGKNLKILHTLIIHPPPPSPPHSLIPLCHTHNQPQPTITLWWQLVKVST